MRLACLFMAFALAVPLAAQRSPKSGPAPNDTLRPFESDAQLLTYFRELRAEQERRRREQDKAYRRYAEKMDKCRKDAVSLSVTSRSDTSKSGAVIGGRVTDSDGEPQASVQITLSALKIGTTSGTDGRFRLTVPAESLAFPRHITLRAGLIGYEPRTRALTISRRDSVDVSLKLCGGQILLQEMSVSASISVDGAAFASRARADEQITNTQHAGVDEGGIVKIHGNHLVILRRGRLFTVAIGGSDLSATAAADAFGPDMNPGGTWYDELLVAGDKVVVIGYSYERGGTEVGVFDIDGRGRLKYSATYQLRSNDYYSARNYASRLIGTKLIFYAPLYLWADPDNVLAALPAARRWYRGAKDSAFKRIAPAPRIYRSPQLSAEDIALHTVTVCDLASTDLGCEATVIVGPSGRVFYVSPSAVYVWASPWSRSGAAEQRGMLYRMPLDGSAPSALGVAGSPVDQFSFLESEDEHLNVLVRSNAYGDAMWAPEFASGDIALLRVPLRAFGDGSDRVPWWQYRRLPAPKDASHSTFHNRFVGTYLLYGQGSGWGRPRGDTTSLFAVPWGARDPAVTRIVLAHGVDRIEQMGSDAVIVGVDSSDLQFTGIRLAEQPTIAQRYVMAGASQGEVRSHGFFYRMDAADSGVLGLPVHQAGRPGYRHLFDGSAGIVFLRNSARRFAPLGTLSASNKTNKDGCRASCVDWYGNARPLFLRGRVFALLGYELVEGSIAGDSIQEVRRISYAPGQQTVAR